MNRHLLAVLLLLFIPRQGYSASTFTLDCYVAPLVFSPRDPNLAIAHTSSWGTLITRDGEHWTEIQDLRGVEVTVIAFHPNEPSQIYVGTRDGSLLVSSDGGRVWQTLTTEFSQGTTSILSLAIDPGNPNILYVGVKGRSLFKSLDGGRTWKRIYNGLDMQCPTEILMASSNFVYVSAISAMYGCDDGRNALFFSSDSGEEWRLIHTVKDLSITDIAPISPGNIYVASEGTLLQSNSRSYRVTFDEETTIEEIHPVASHAVLVATPKGLFKASEGSLEPVLPGEYVTSIASSPRKPESLYLGVLDLGILHSLDSGQTWHLDERCPDSPRQGFTPGEADRDPR